MSKTTNPAGTLLEVALFDHGSFVGTRRCRSVREARAFMEGVDAASGTTCLLVSPRLGESLLAAG